MTLREEIVARLDEWAVDHGTEDCPWGGKGCLHEAVDALRAVVLLHEPGTRLGEEEICKGCEVKDVAFVWLDRCKTLAAIAAVLFPEETQ